MASDAEKFTEKTDDSCIVPPLQIEAVTDVVGIKKIYDEDGYEIGQAKNPIGGSSGNDTR